MPQSVVAESSEAAYEPDGLAELVASQFFRKPLEDLQREVSHTPGMESMAQQVRVLLALLHDDSIDVKGDEELKAAQKLVDERPLEYPERITAEKTLANAREIAVEKGLTVLAEHIFATILKDGTCKELFAALLDFCGYDRAPKSEASKKVKYEVCRSALRGALREISAHRDVYLRSPEKSRRTAVALGHMAVSMV
ncbi:MAG: hypothetical protein ABI303_04080 [Candidatus Saccharimonas sp.]